MKRLDIFTLCIIIIIYIFHVTQSIVLYLE